MRYNAIKEENHLSKFKKVLFILLLGILLSFPSDLQAQLIEPKSPVVETSGDVFLLALPASAALTTILKKTKKASGNLLRASLQTLLSQQP